MKSRPKWSHGLNARVRTDYLLGPHTTFKIGGPAEFMVNARDAEAVGELVQRLEGETALRVMGAGSNILVDDAGISGVVLSLAGTLREIYIEEGMLDVGAGVKLRALLKEAADLGFTGLESLAGIPGTVGGAVQMNAGGREGTIGDAVHSVTCVSDTGQLETLTREQCAFGYRANSLAGKIVLSARLRLVEEDRKVIVRKMSEMMAVKKRTQPLGSLSAGCVFKNPPGEKSAADLIREAGLVGEHVGGAYVSAKHANYIINREGASFDDVSGLIDMIVKRVEDLFGVRLALEIEIWSDREPLRKKL